MAAKKTNAKKSGKSGLSEGEIAEAILQVAIGKDSAVNPRIEPWIEPIRTLAKRLAAKIEANDTDEEEDVAVSFFD